MKQTITINIVNFNMFEGKDYHTEVAAIIKGTGEVFSDKFAIHFFELKKIGKTPNLRLHRTIIVVPAAVRFFVRLYRIFAGRLICRSAPLSLRDTSPARGRSPFKKILCNMAEKMAVDGTAKA
ncbi:MAG: Rpn family recombination-promoting nuclease/putative transposase [Bacteroides sp.]|nr:Rpn family recombination-promoting nuclease/putative transposase [Bacteroides sp.]